MVFKFFKGLADAVKEGLEEGRAEARQEAAQAEADQGAELQRLADIDPRERFCASLAAPLRRLFIDDAPHYLASMDLPEAKRPEVAQFLERDFDVSDGADLAERVADLSAPLQASEAIDTAALALCTCRMAYMASAAVGLGYVTREQALELVQAPLELCARRIDGWAAYGALYLEGEKQDGTNNLLGRKVMASQVNRLQEEFWPHVPWGTA